MDASTEKSKHNDGTEVCEAVGITTQNSADWYVQSSEGLAGPLSKSALCSLYQGGAINDLSFVWRNGMQEWKKWANVPELGNSAGSTEDLVRDKRKLTRDATGEQCMRLPLEDISSEFKYITPEGVGQVFDTVTSTWMSFNEYQMMLSITSDDVTAENNPLLKKEKNTASRKRYRERQREKKKEGIWIKPKNNPNIYATNLPLDITVEELEVVFKRAGLLKVDSESGQAKIKIYKTPDGTKANGDALISFVNPASVDLAIKYLDGYELRPGHKIKIEQAKFDFSQKQLTTPRIANPQLKHQKYIAAKLERDRLLGWSDGLTNFNSRIMILQPLWTVREAELHASNSDFYKSISKKVENSLNEWIPVKKVTAIERHPKGLVCVKFKTFEECEVAVARLNNRSFYYLNLPDRFCDINLQHFREWEQKQRLDDFSSSSRSQSSFPPLDSIQHELLQKLDDIISRKDGPQKRAKLPKRQIECPFRTKSDLEESLEDEVVLAKTKTISQNTDGLLESPRTSMRRKRLADFLYQRPLLIEAYVYDNKTDLKQQVIPDHSIDQSNYDENEKTHKSWSSWLDESSSDDDELKIRTEV